MNVQDAINYIDTFEHLPLESLEYYNEVLEAARRSIKLEDALVNPDFEGTLIRSEWNGDRRLWTLRMSADVDAGHLDQFALIRLTGTGLEK